MLSVILGFVMLFLSVKTKVSLVIENEFVSTWSVVVFFFQAEDGIRDADVTGVQTCALPIHPPRPARTSATARPCHQPTGQRRKDRLPTLHRNSPRQSQPEQATRCVFLPPRPQQKRTGHGRNFAQHPPAKLSETPATKRFFRHSK